MGTTKHDPIFRTIGLSLIVLGIAGLFVAAFMSSTPYAEFDNGAIPAVSFLSIMLGFAFCFPSLLQESEGQLSTMRIIVFAVTMVFCVIYIKLGWQLSSFSTFSISNSWVYILGLAFGSKVFQRFGERGDNEAETDTTSTATPISTLAPTTVAVGGEMPVDK